MGLLQNVKMVVSGRKRHWEETNTVAITRLQERIRNHFSQEDALRETFEHFLAGSAVLASQMIYEGNPRKSRIRVDIRDLSEKELVDAHILGTQLHGTMFSDINRDTIPLGFLHLIFARVFPETGVIESIARCAGREKFDLAPYASTYCDGLASLVGAAPPSPLDWFASIPIIALAFQPAVDGIKAKFGGQP